MIVLADEPTPSVPVRKTSDRGIESQFLITLMIVLADEPTPSVPVRKTSDRGIESQFLITLMIVLADEPTPSVPVRKTSDRGIKSQFTHYANDRPGGRTDSVGSGLQNFGSWNKFP